MVPKTSSKPPVTYHVVRERGGPAVNQAGSNPKHAVGQANPMRAAGVQPKPANPIRGIESRVSIPSVRSFVRLAVCLVAALQSVSAQAETGSIPTSAPLDAPPGGVDDVVSLLSELGVGVFYVAQGNEGDDASLLAMNAVLHGLLDEAGAGTLLQQDVERPPCADTRAPSAIRGLFENAISKNVDQIGDDPHGGFADLWSSGRLSPFTVSSDPTQKNHLGRVIKARHGTVVGLSKEFAFYLHAGPNTLRFPGRTETVPVTEPYRLAEPQLAKQNESYGLFQASSDARPSALIVTTQTVAPEEVEELWDHFKGQFTVCMVPLDYGVQAMIVAPLSARSELMGLLKQLSDLGVHPTRPAATLEQWSLENKFVVEDEAVEFEEAVEEPDESGAGPTSSPAESAPIILGQWIEENSALLGVAASAIAGACVFVFKRAKPSPRAEAGAVPNKGSDASQRGERGGKVQHPQDEGKSAPFNGTPVSYQGKPAAASPPSTPEAIAASIVETIREKQANGKAALKQYLHEKGAEFRAQLHPVTGGGAEAVADVAFQLYGIIESTLGNAAQMRRWFEHAEFMDGVNFDFVFQTVRDYQQLNPQNEKLAKAAAMLQGHVRLVPRGEPDEVEHKGWQGPTPRTSRPRDGNGPQSASAPTGANSARTLSQVTIADIYKFGKKLAAEEVPPGADRHGVRLGRDIYIPSAAILPHWHLNEDFVVYKHNDTNHIEVARGSDMRLGSAASVGMRLDRTVSRDQQLLRIQAFIMTGKDALFFESNAA
jgi:hypothetical protein